MQYSPCEGHLFVAVLQLLVLGVWGFCDLFAILLYVFAQCQSVDAGSMHQFNYLETALRFNEVTYR